MVKNESLLSALALQRQQLVDVGKRNPLTNTPLNRARSRYLEISDELSEQVFKRLDTEGKSFTFLPRAQQQSDTEAAAQGSAVYIPDAVTEAVHERHTDSKLQTELTPEALQKNLLSLYRENRRIEEEQGINVLNLALGFLEYFDAASSSVARFAPLVLLPVNLNRSSARSQFSLDRRDDEIEPNHSIANLLSGDFEIALPVFGDIKGESLLEYFQRVQETIGLKERWIVHVNRIALGFFSFGKHRMYRDLELQESEGNELVEELLVGGSSESSTGAQVSITATQEPLDQKFANPKDLGHILDADTSQTEVISKVTEGKNLVVQGPPGTGKSQTIANIIAVMARAGKKILFIAEKKAALEVVYRRLDLAGLGPLCLELHSQKSTRKVFYEEIRKTMELKQPVEVANQHYEETKRVRDELNELSNLVHTVDEQTGNTPYLLMGRMSQLVGSGVPLAKFSINEIDLWSAEEFDDKFKAVVALAEHTQKVGAEGQHLWRGVKRRMNAANRVRLTTMLEQVGKQISEILSLTKNEINWEPISRELSLSKCIDLEQLLSLINDYSESWKDLFAHSQIASYSTKLSELCDKVETSQGMREHLSECVVSGAFQMNWEIVLRDLALNEKSMFRMFNGAYKRAKQLLLSVAKIPLKSVQAQIELAKQLLAHESLVAEIQKQSELGRSFFDLAWAGETTEVSQTRQALAWLDKVLPIVGTVDQACAFIQYSASIRNLDGLRDRLDTNRLSLSTALSELAEFAEIDWAVVTDATSLEEFSLSHLAERVHLWIENIEQLDDYSILVSLGNELERVGLSVVREQLATGELDPVHAKDTFRLHRAESVFNRLVQANPQIRHIDGADRSRKVELFAKFDKELQSLSAQELARKHYLEIPRGQTGQLALLRGEINKKARHMSIRNLLMNAGDAITQIKPVFMMSPLSVAQYLEPGVLKFDLLLIDEASQVKPAEALGAMMRCKQVVVVGDQKQMPPTSFFDRQMADEGDDDEEVSLGSQAVHMESILSLCDARAMERAMLSWHYRSEHPSLIEVSNHEFYENKLTYPPSPFTGVKHSGLSFVQADGVYMRGRLRNNPIEGDTICEHVLQHVQEHPSQSLGVVALSVAQRDLIDNKMEFLRAKHSEVDAFCADSKEEPCFVKNLENVQGDERDVIYISIGYGRDADGYFAQNFGPVSSEGGERRLNVLFTRARKKCIVFASISHEDIRTDVSAHAGPRVLKTFLKYAATGDMDVPRITGEEFDSPFEEDVASVILSFGFHVEGQVGTSGFKIDLVVCDPDDPSVYLLAVECDGARYHSSAWARERDRLRQQVLEGKGWKFHRIWSTDWFYNRETEIKKLLAAIDVARSTHAGGKQNAAPQEPPSKTVTIERTESTESVTPTSSIQVQPYAETDVDVSHRSHEPLTEIYSSRLAAVIKNIVAVESPVHEYVVAKRVIDLWGVKRLGSKIQESIDYAIQHAVDRELVRRLSGESNFLVTPDFQQPTLRDRADVTWFVKKIEHVSLAELQLGVMQIIEDGISVSGSECINTLCRLLGFGRATEGIQSRIQSAIDRLVVAGRVLEQDGKLRLQ